jgi:5-methylcytosine-specific restriction endonuclease McrA
MRTDWDRVRLVVWYRDGGKCMKCGKRLLPNNFHVDHIIPISKGGDEWDLSNLELSCPSCNLSKGIKYD